MSLLEVIIIIVMSFLLLVQMGLMILVIRGGFTD